jgi:4-amino-4-deoxy-L-arabinose transferase-like glycosyltransferase
VSTGLLAALLLLFSPFFLTMASNFMSHGTAAFYLLVSLFFLVRPTQKRGLSLFASGAFLGLLFNTRPLVGAALLVPFGLLFAYEFLTSPGERKRLFRQDLAFAAGFALLFLLFYLYNYARIGDFDLLGSSYVGKGERLDVGTFLFGNTNSLARELQDEKTLLALFTLVANGWPVTIGLLFAALPFILGTRNRWDYFLGGCFLVLAAAPAFVHFGGSISNFYGPRIWYELVPFFMLLSARGVQRLIEAGSSTASRIAVRLSSKGPTGTLGTTGLLVYSLIIALVVFSASGWILEKRQAWPPISFTPERISRLEGFNGIERRLQNRVEEMEIHNALILVRTQGCDWRCYGSVFWENSPDLDSDVVYAKDLGVAENRPLIEHYKGRSVYIADYKKDTIEPYSIEGQ